MMDERSLGLFLQCWEWAYERGYSFVARQIDPERSNEDILLCQKRIDQRKAELDRRTRKADQDIPSVGKVVMVDQPGETCRSGKREKSFLRGQSGLRVMADHQWAEIGAAAGTRACR